MTSSGVACAIPWCVCLAVRDGVKCRVHSTRGEVRPIACATGEAIRGESVGEDCPDCDGDGTCVHCDGEGTHDCGQCQTDHDCGRCDGTGDCEACGGDGITNGATCALSEDEKEERRIARRKGLDYETDEEAYLREAFYVPSPLPPVFETPWETAQ